MQMYANNGRTHLLLGLEAAGVGLSSTWELEEGDVAVERRRGDDIAFGRAGVQLKSHNALEF
jgi:hypothetical protein